MLRQETGTVLSSYKVLWDFHRYSEKLKRGFKSHRSGDVFLFFFFCLFVLMFRWVSASGFESWNADFSLEKGEYEKKRLPTFSLLPSIFLSSCTEISSENLWKPSGTYSFAAAVKCVSSFHVSAFYPVAFLFDLLNRTDLCKTTLVWRELWMLHYTLQAIPSISFLLLIFSSCIRKSYWIRRLFVYILVKLASALFVVWPQLYYY